MTEHNTSTEVLIIISQTVFFILLFLLLKNGLVDRRGMLSSKERINEDLFQILAIFLAIFVIIALFMIPIESYEYAHFVVPITFSIMLIIILWEFYVVFNGGNNNSNTLSPIITQSNKTVRFDLEKNSDDNNSKSSNSSGTKFNKMFSFGSNSGITTVGATKRPVNF